MPKKPIRDFDAKTDFLLGRKGNKKLAEYRQSVGSLPKGFPGIKTLEALCAELTSRVGREIKPNAFSEYRGFRAIPPADVVRAIARLYGFDPPVDTDDEAFAWWSEHWPSWWTPKTSGGDRKDRDTAALFAEAYLEALKAGTLSFPARPVPIAEATESATVLTPEMQRELQLKAAIGALRASRSIAEARRRKDSAFQLFDRFERSLGLMEGVLASGVPDRVERLFRLYSPVEDDIRKIEAEGLASCFDTLDGVKAGLDAINPAQPSSATSPGIPNDLLLGEELPHWRARQDLLHELESVEQRLQDAIPVLSASERQQLAFDLEELRIIVDRDPIRPEELAGVRDRLDALKLDLLRRLRIATQLFMGVHAALLPPGAVFQDDERAPEMVIIRAGSFIMGSPPEEKERRDDEGPQHGVSLAQRFALGRYPVTFTEYDRFTHETEHEPAEDDDWDRGRRPVINVSWKNAQTYVAWLSEETGQPYRLPSEAEWEYACRAGTVTRYSFGDAITQEDANFGQNVGNTTEVGSYSANPWGLYDMHGNVWDWCADAWHDNYEGDARPDDGLAWGEGGEKGRRVLRGGSWSDFPGDLRSAFRCGYSTGYRNYSVGFRVARALR